MSQLTRKIFVAFCLISIIPLLAFAYLILPYLLPIVTYARATTIIVFITTVIVVLGFSLLFGLSRNITKLSTSADIIAKGNFTHSVQVKEGNEVDELASSLNKITQRLREDINDLETNAILVDRANKELNRLNKLKSEFVSMVSHELRAPLINIKQATSLLLNTATEKTDEKGKRSLEIINRSAERLLKLISDLLDISRIEAGELKLNRQMVNIGKVIQDAAESLERWREIKKIWLKLEIEPILPDIYADPDRMSQILVNLLSNAIKFTPVGGEITIKTETEKRGDFLQISVTDTGCGIHPKEQDKVFDRFKQVGRDSSAHMQGIGLGLSITREIVKMHGGNIWLESKIGQGSKFTFTLPKYTENEALLEDIDNRIAITRKVHKEFSVFIIKLDNYLEIKGELGEKKVQKTFLNMLEAFKNVIRTGESVSARNKDEIVVLTEVNGQGVSEIKSRLKNAIKEYIFEANEELKINFSFGYSTYPNDGSNVKDLLEKAQKSLISERMARLMKNIMIVDDEPVVLEALKKLLKKLGYISFIGAYDGDEALLKLKILIPDLLILDMRMPIMNGYQVIERLKEHADTKDIPILIISGYDVEVDRFKECTEGVPIPIMRKPINIGQLNRLVNYLL